MFGTYVLQQELFFFVVYVYARLLRRVMYRSIDIAS
jgi:hypothetical protein